MARNSLGRAVAALVLAVPRLAGGAPAPADYDVAAVFVETDSNGDGLIEVDEYHARLNEIFYHGDANKDGSLSPVELHKAVVIPEDFARADRDGNGQVSLREFIAVRLPLFQRSDSNHDGALSLEEVKAALALGPQ